jgi:hypothetical protein
MHSVVKELAAMLFWLKDGWRGSDGTIQIRLFAQDSHIHTLTRHHSCASNTQQLVLLQDRGIWHVSLFCRATFSALVRACVVFSRKLSMMRRNNLDGAANVVKSRYDRGLRCALTMALTELANDNYATS